MVETSLEAVVCAEPHCCWRFRASALTESTWPLELVSPSRTRRADFPHRAPQMTFTKSSALDRWMQIAREGQLKPRALTQALPAQPTSLTSAFQGMLPLTPTSAHPVKTAKRHARPLLDLHAMLLRLDEGE
jgi:hypothetical protein